MKIKTLFLGLFLSLNVVLTVQAENHEKHPPLVTGMTYEDVLKNWGAPKEKLEYETIREDSWIYSTDIVKFRGGRLIEVIPHNPNQLNLPLPQPSSQATKNEPAPKNIKAQQENDEDWGAYEPVKNDLSLADLLKDVSSDNSKATTPNIHAHNPPFRR